MRPPAAPPPLLLLLLLAAGPARSPEPPEPGCHLTPFTVTLRGSGSCRGSRALRACAGHCESSAFPSRRAVLEAAAHNVTSASRCCTIARLAKVRVRLQCPGGGREELEMFTAKACQCDMCRLSRY
ncbi:glycoprotein hormone alpha-2 [Alligator mississippiensis]|uniref:glycoprotein hormone alpha-2 n=1 Tax=Alligator mississippiensis TaxID=8496 RepID=UPI002877C446|nr:glycoprotein hormone alpha-2 [Alligator mississippiensis]